MSAWNLVHLPLDDVDWNIRHFGSSTEVCVKSGRQDFWAKISDNALPGSLPRQCVYRISKFGSSLPILCYKTPLKIFMGLLL